ncbi:MAG: DUF819 family protein [Candidatus Omnitrophica bacterium]|nr:DUF819 family protein [Candidatus Omnitrophota bacterium]
MIHNAPGIIVVLLVIEGGILYCAGHPRTKRFFKFLPAVFWIYFLPMLASTAGLINPDHAIYGMITKNLLPARLFLLLLCVDVKAVQKLGPKALTMMLAGSGGIMIGTVTAFYFLKDIVGEKMWPGFGALSASWMGGSANMVAVKEALSTPDDVFLPMVIVDTIVPYFWMGVLVSAAAWQPVVDRFNRADTRVLAELDRKLADATTDRPTQAGPWVTIGIVAVALTGGYAAMFIAGYLPVIKDVISTYAWTVIAASLLGLALSFTPVKELRHYGSERVGYVILYFVLTSIGARASLQDAGSSLVLIGAGFLIVFIHAVILLVVARLVRAPLFLAAAASQANLGGVASAPIVAEVYHPGLASVGLLMAVFGGILGTYLGIITGQICRLLIGIGGHIP